MKVAVVLTGHLRMFQKVFPNFKERIIDRYQPDIFISTWRDEGYWVPQEGRLGIQEGSPLVHEHEIRAAYNPKELLMEDFYSLEPIFAERAKNFPTYYHRPRNIISMFYKMQSGVSLMKSHMIKTGTKYNLVIRMRPDMLLHEPLPAFQDGTFYTLAHRNHMGGGTGDMFQIGSVDQVSKFCDIGFKLESIYEQTKLLCPHVMSVKHIQNSWLPWKEFSISKSIQHTPNGEYGNGG